MRVFLVLGLFSLFLLHEVHAQFAFDRVIVKLDNQFQARTLESASFLDIDLLSSQYSIAVTHTIQRSALNRTANHRLADIYTIEVPAGKSVDEWLTVLSNYDNVVYAEPYYTPEMLYVPNDPLAAVGGQQNYLSVIKAYEAWSITRGDKNIIIGILDSGSKPDHEDLSLQIAINPNDPINGIDDDGDGYIDNYYGWDMADNDNNPSPGLSGHGTLVAGVAAAKADNRVGVAGVGFNSTFMPIKIYTSATGQFNRGYEAIAYAADMGCKVINLSWGSASAYSQFAQDIINYAVLDKDVVIVAAAGNTNAELKFYPASYDQVLSVAATDLLDQKTPWSTYSTSVDLCAPGDNIISTGWAGNYIRDSGTSLSAPMVAGTAALVRARYPHLNARQVAERIRASADASIYNLPANQNFKEKLGKGRLNMFRALTEEGLQSVRIQSIRYANKLGVYILPDDTLELSLDLINYLSPVQGLTVQLESANPYAEIISGSWQVGTLETMQQSGVNAVPFKVYLKDNLPPNQILNFRVAFVANGYTDYQYFTLTATGTAITIRNNQTNFTINSNGIVGASNPSNTNQGLFYDTRRIAAHVGLIVATSEQKLTENAITNFESQLRANEWQAQLPLRNYNNSTADIDFRNRLTENAVVVNKTGIMVEQKVLTWQHAQDTNYMVIEYRLTNTTSQTITNTYIANLVDINIGNKDANKIEFDASNKMMYAFGSDNGPKYAAWAALSNHLLTAQALEVGNENNNQHTIANTPSKSEKYTLLQQGETLAKTRAGINGVGNDVAILLGNKINSIGAYQSVKLAFVYINGNSVDQLQKSLTSAKLAYQKYVVNPPISDLYFACENASISIQPKNGNQFDFYRDAALTNKVITAGSMLVNLGTSDTLFYIQNADQLYKGDVSVIRIMVKEPQANFNLVNTQFLMEPGVPVQIPLFDESSNAYEWHWNFGNGTGSTLRNPVAAYHQAGNYSIQLTVKTPWGCQSVLERSIQIIERAPKPIVNTTLRVCQGEVAIIEATNTNLIRVYADANASQLLYEGNRFESEPLNNAPIYYVSNMEGGVESTLSTVQVALIEVIPDFEIRTDVNSLNAKQFIITNKSINASAFQWYINNQWVSDEDDPMIIIPAGDQIQISLLAINEFGCEKELVRHYDRNSSSTPGNLEFQVCLNTTQLIEPTNGTDFHFYADASKSVLLKKGRNITVTVRGDTSIYFTNVDRVIESELARATIQLEQLDAAFTLSRDVLNLTIEKEIEFTAQVFTHTFYKWRINNQLVSTQPSFKRTFLAEGEYTVSLEVSNEENCSGFHSTSFRADYLLAISQPSEVWKVYPNPASNALFIEFTDQKSRNIELMTLSGKVIFKLKSTEGKQLLTIPIEEVRSGVYLLKIDNRYEKIIVQH